MSSAVLWGRSDTARSTARRCAVTCIPCGRTAVSGSSVGTLGNVAARTGLSPEVLETRPGPVSPSPEPASEARAGPAGEDPSGERAHAGKLALPAFRHPDEV